MPSGRARTARRRRFKSRQQGKLAVDAVLFGVVQHFLLEGWSPGQRAGTLKVMWPDSPDRTISAETLHTCIYALPRGALRKELIPGLRQARSACLLRTARIIGGN
ncbi:MAG: hypothetical protein KBE53_07240 [Chromatiaceae bacterium]|nr:hypothetical protein [Chromatiaceae bacterium]